MKGSTGKLISIEDLERPFIEGEGTTITLRKVAGVNYQQIKGPKLQDIPESQEPEDDDDDDFEKIQETQKPAAGIQMDIYKTSFSKNTQNSTQISTNLSSFSSLAAKISQQDKNIYIQQPEDHLKLYVMIQNNTVLALSDIIEQFKDDFKHNLKELYEMAAQNQTLALVDYENYHNDERTPSAKMLEEYLKFRSKKYQNIIEINELAQGAEAIVFRLEHHEIDEVVVKTNKVFDLSQNQEFFQQPFIDFMRETLSLKLLQNKNYIAEVREEIIEFDLKSKQISRYCVVVEKAQRTLDDLLKIWNNPDQSEKYVEAYSPEKLAYFFYQALSIIKYLHSKNFYYGDMKPQNLLIFRNQKVKVGDLGISFKLDSKIQADEHAYQLKGLTKNFATEITYQAMRKGKLQSKDQLFEADRYSLIRVFQHSINQVKSLHSKQESKYKQLPQQIMDDMIQLNSISSVHQKYQIYFRENDEFVTTLFQQMKNEFKFDAIKVISRISRYSEIFENKVFKIIRKISENSLRKQYENQNIEKLEKHETIEDEQNDLANNLQFRQQLCDVLQSQKNLKDYLGYPILENKELILSIESYLHMNNPQQNGILGTFDCFEITDNILACSYFQQRNTQAFDQYIRFIEYTVNDLKQIYNITDKLASFIKNYKNKNSFVKNDMLEIGYDFYIRLMIKLFTSNSEDKY
ncbi:serine threonine protein kinase-like protein [Stylonychia lemnae]|uniref:Cyclin-dependent kinase 2 homolog n=1 Tax=Stylonychia lemnae TaxID=5949 RepID=A0A077ZU67_STYLE|nr:serine threonine protein kinase-like protein [Stylonychia lemnae]|eukprot:CDW73119.1 serine threonine protein kinase-like protein [Stylonychia lemnae]